MSDWLYPIPDPFAEGDDAASYVTDSGFRRFMGDLLVEARIVTDGVSSHVELWVVGDTTELYEDAVLLASDDSGSGGVPFDDRTLGATTGAAFVGLRNPDTAECFYWVVGADGSQTLYEAPDDEFATFLVPDQRLEASFRDFPHVSTDLNLSTIPPASVEASVAAGELDTNNALGSTWAAIILGDTSIERDQPSPPDPFDVTQTSNGFHTGDGAIVFDQTDESGDQFGIWENAFVQWTSEAPNPPIMNFGFIGSAPLIIDVPIEPGNSPLPTDGTLIDQYREAYKINTLGGNAAGGQISLFFDPDLNPDTPLDYMDTVTANLVGTRTIEPAAAHAYRQGEYRYIRTGLDDESTYVLQLKGAPGTEYMWSQLVEAANGRWTGVVSLQQDGDNFGGGTACSFCVYFEPSGTPGVLLPLRQYPRSDGLAASSANRVWPPPRSVQHSNRRAGGYI